ncbi:MAG: EAL domain-containing protein [Synechococcales cyanobacterium T60_A2020_003]|nr:EAL domain-containing protein [Synechococcales cyanobacterium T60_A2020_003]
MTDSIRSVQSYILIVDDTPMNLHLLSATLTERGYEVRGVVNGAMALRVAKNAPPDLILLDIKMPDLSGYEVCQLLKEDPETREIPVIFLSALDETLDKVKAFEVGGGDYITRPYQIPEVIARIENQLAICRARQEIAQLNQALEELVQQRTRELEDANRNLQQEIQIRTQTERSLQTVLQELNFHVGNTPLAVIQWDSNFAIERWSSQAEQMFGWTEPEVLGKTMTAWQFVYEEDEAQVHDRIQPLLAGEQSRVISRNRNYTKSGDVLDCEWYNSALVDESGQFVSGLSLVLDVTDRKRAERSLQASEERLRLITENMRDLVCLHEPTGRYLYISPSCETLLGYAPDELIGQDPNTLVHPDDRDRLQIAAHTLDRQEALSSLTYRMQHKSGEFIWVETLSKLILGDNSEIIRLVSVSRDITARVRAEQKLSHDALHDALTQLPNRALFMARVEMALSQMIRHKSYQFAVLFIDLDRFKVVNDSLGPLVGDRILLETARLLQGCLRPADTLARLSGDEFTLLLDDIKDMTDATRVAERIQTLLKTPFDLDGHRVTMSASIGIVMGSTEYQQATELLRDADIAMYRAKETGKAHYEIFDREMHRRAVHLLQIETDLRHAIERHELVLYYQPIVAIATGQLAGFEALMRWQHPEQGLIPPDHFIPIAEDSGLIIPLGEMVLRLACQKMQQWQHRWPMARSLMMSVNLASKQIRDPAFVPTLTAILQETRLDGRCLKLEITERMLMENTDAVVAVLRQIREQGVQLSIDDFETGYSSMAYLQHFPINSLKIDRSFTHQLSHPEGKSAIVRAIVTLAQNLSLTVIVEGIETQEQLARIKEIGAEYGQGYYFSKPLPEEQADALLDQNTHHPILFA